MILISMALVLVGAVTLVVGFFNESRPGFIYTTIGASLLAAVFLVLGIVRQRSSPTRPAFASGGGDNWGPRSWDSGGGVGTLDADDATFGGVEIAYDDDPTDTAHHLSRTEAKPRRTFAGRGKPVHPDDWWAPEQDESLQNVQWEDPDEQTGQHATWQDVDPHATTAQPSWEPTETGRWDPPELEVAQDLAEPEIANGEFADYGNLGEPKLVVQTPPGATVSMADRETERFLNALRPVRGVGPSKQSELLAHFKTLRKLRNASVERIADVPGISTTLAQRIHNQLHS